MSRLSSQYFMIDITPISSPQQAHLPAGRSVKCGLSRKDFEERPKIERIGLRSQIREGMDEGGIRPGTQRNSERNNCYQFCFLQQGRKLEFPCEEDSPSPVVSNTWRNIFNSLKRVVFVSPDLPFSIILLFDIRICGIMLNRDNQKILKGAADTILLPSRLQIVEKKTCGLWPLLQRESFIPLANPTVYTYRSMLKSPIKRSRASGFLCTDDGNRQGKNMTPREGNTRGKSNRKSDKRGHNLLFLFLSYWNGKIRMLTVMRRTKRFGRDYEMVIWRVFQMQSRSIWSRSEEDEVEQF